MKVLIVTYKPFAESTEENNTQLLLKWINTLELKDYRIVCSTNKTGVNKGSVQEAMFNLEFNEDIDSYDKIIAIGEQASKVVTKIGKTHFKFPFPNKTNKQVMDKEYMDKCIRDCSYYLYGMV